MRWRVEEVGKPGAKEREYVLTNGRARISFFGDVPEDADVAALRRQLDTGREYEPTKEAHFCTQTDAMGNGCRDSRWVGGNYGGALCHNPAHRKQEQK